MSSLQTYPRLQAIVSQFVSTNRRKHGLLYVKLKATRKKKTEVFSFSCRFGGKFLCRLGTTDFDLIGKETGQLWSNWRRRITCGDSWLVYFFVSFMKILHNMFYFYVTTNQKHNLLSESARTKWGCIWGQTRVKSEYSQRLKRNTYTFMSVNEHIPPRCMA